MSDDSDDEGTKSLPQPFSIMVPLGPKFGYSDNFIAGKLLWNFPESTAVSTGGGRYSDEDISDLVDELNNLTTEGANLVARQLCLKTLFMRHYDAPRIEFQLYFMLPDCVKARSSLTKEACVDLLVEAGVPFIPCNILIQHLEAGLKLWKGKKWKGNSNIDWASHYEKYAKEYPFGEDKIRQEQDFEKAQKLASGISKWERNVRTHNKAFPDKRIEITNKEMKQITGSQFSFSENGNPHFHDDAKVETSLKSKLMEATETKRQRDEARAAALESAAKKLRSGLSVASSKARPAKKSKHARSDSDSDDDSGMNALDIFMKKMRAKVERYDYIDFASLSTSRQFDIKMLNTTSVKTQRLAAGLVLKHSLGEGDIKILSDDLPQILDGFMFHYLRLIHESQIEASGRTVFDRIAWWHWITNNFVGNPAGQVMFIKFFVAEHHREEFWEPVVRVSHSLVTKCKEATAAGVSHPSRPPRDVKTSRHVGASGGKGASKHTQKSNHQPLTQAQLAKIETWRAKYPSICLSRIVRGRGCFHEAKGTHCKFKHECAWCGVASCKANCSSAELL
jgi:hypothetical protein